MSRKQGGWESPCSEGSLEYFINPPPCKKTIHYNKKNKNKNKKITKQISVLAEKLDKTWREKLQSKIKEDSETIKKMFELMDREEFEKLQAEEESNIRKQERKKTKFTEDEEEEEEDEEENDETMSSFSNDQEDVDDEEQMNNEQYRYSKSKHSPQVGGNKSNCLIKEINAIENIGNWDVILSDEEEEYDDDWNDNYATVSDKSASKENLKIEKIARGCYKNDEQVLEMSETETDEETGEEDISSKSEENEKESDDQEECVVIVEESEDETDQEEAENYIVEQEEEENWEEDDEDEEKKAKLEERMTSLSETLEKLKAELHEAKQAVEEEKKTIVLPGHVCTIAEPCTVAAQLEERLRARREAAAASYCEGLQQVERMVSQEIIRLEEDMNKLQPLNKIAADWELPQDSKLNILMMGERPKPVDDHKMKQAITENISDDLLQSIMYRQDYMLVTDMTLNIPSGLKPYLKSEINEVN